MSSNSRNSGRSVRGVLVGLTRGPADTPRGRAVGRDTGGGTGGDTGGGSGGRRRSPRVSHSDADAAAYGGDEL